MQMTRKFVLYAAAVLAVAMFAAGCGDDKAGQGVPAGGGGISPQYSQDVRMYEQALASDPDNADILIQLGNRYYDWGEEEVRVAGEKANPIPKWLKGVEYYGRALKIDPTNADVRTDMANLLNWMGRFDEAEKEYRTAANMAPTHAQSRINLILLLGARKGEYKEALKQYDELLKFAPEQKNNQDLAEEVEGYRQMMQEAKK